MSDYIWTINFFGVRIGWQKYITTYFYHQKNYLSIGKLDFYKQ